MSRRLAYWICVAAAVVVYATMMLWTLPGIAAAAGGLPAFDLRPWGYSTDEARTFLTALTDEGRALYTGPQKLLDLIYPALLAIVLGGATRHLFPRGMLASIVMACVAGGMAADYLENMRVAVLLAGDHSEAAVVAASRATILKSALTSIALIVILARLLRISLNKWTAK